MNGSYLVFRQLSQDVTSFWRYCDDQTRQRDGASNAAARTRLAAKMVGRWPGGAPLVKSAYRDDPAFSSENGDVMHWKTEGAPDQWTVAVTDSREPVWEEFAVPMTTFLAQLLSGRLTCGIFPPDFLEGGPRFTPKG